MFALPSVSRHALIGLAVAAFCGAFAVVPGEVASTLAPNQSAPELGAAHAPVLPAPVLAARDPFEARGRDDSGPNPSPPPLPSLGEIPHIRPLPPNAAAGPFPFATRAATKILAVVSGPHPTALIEESGHPRTVAVGDDLGGARIAAIDEIGITFQNGRRLAFPNSPEELLH